MFDDPEGPITHFEWASFTINGQVHNTEQGVGKDIMLSPAGLTPWKEREGHLLKPKMLKRAVDLHPDVLIVGNGVQGALDVSKKARKYVKEAGIPDLLILKTPDACREYNRQSRQGKRVILLAHGTC